MAEKYFKLMIGVFFLLAFIALIAGSGSNNDNYNVNVTQMVAASSGLDLKAVGEILKKSDDAKSFEKLLNDPSTGVNNLDLDADGKVDFIKVTEFGDDKVKGFSLTTELKNSEVQEIATIKIEKSGDSDAKIETRGNSNIYGSNTYYHSSWGGGTGFLLGYMWGAHRPYYSPWSYGYYPGYYRSYSVSPHSDYRRRTSRMTSNKNYVSSKTSRLGSNVQSPNRGRSASGIKAPLRNPTASQRSFQSRSQTRKVRSGGFGRSSSVRGGRSFGGK